MDEAVMSTLQSPNGIDELITHIYQGSLEPQPWQTFLHSLRLHMGCDSAVMLLSSSKNGISAPSIWDNCSGVCRDDTRKAVDEYLRRAHLAPLDGVQREASAISTIDEVISREELINKYYHKVLQPLGIEHQLGLYFSEPNGWNCQLCVINSAGKRNFDAADKQFFAALRPHLEHALKIFALLKHNELEKKIYGNALDQLTIGAIILNGEERVIETNEVAQRLLRESACISLVDHKLVPTKTRYATELNRLIKQALAWRQHHRDEPFVDALRIESQSGSSVGMLIRSVPLTRWYENDGSPSVVIYLEGLAHQQAPEQFIARLFGLTLSEANLASLLANGLTLAEAAAELGLAESSVRTYSKKIFSKTGVNRQAELVRLILKSVALLAGSGTQPSNLHLHDKRCAAKA
jgi:DNA-binding CsgD family transcriptional regulator/PAS domain-containing protein